MTTSLTPEPTSTSRRPAGGGPATGHRAAPVLWLGLAASVVAVLAVVLDQAAIGSIADTIDETYRDYPDVRDDGESWVVTYLLSVGVLGVAGWLSVLRGHARGRRWTRPVAVTLFVLGLGVAVLDLTVTEYGGHLVPVWLGLVGLLPCAVGALALVRLWSGPTRTR